jgi:hypothetical protein
LTGVHALLLGTVCIFQYGLCALMWLFTKPTVFQKCDLSLSPGGEDMQRFLFSCAPSRGANSKVPGGTLAPLIQTIKKPRQQN